MFKYHDTPIPVPFLKFGWAKIGMEKLLIQDSIEGWARNPRWRCVIRVYWLQPLNQQSRNSI